MNWPLLSRPRPKRRCSDCALWSGDMFNNFAECRARAPHARRTESGGLTVGGEWPLTMPDDWCGRFEKRATPPPEEK